jgi:hypothetical protein
LRVGDGGGIGRRRIAIDQIIKDMGSDDVDKSQRSAAE